MKKRLLALILCLVMVIGLVPTAFATATDGDGELGGTLTIYLKNSRLNKGTTIGTLPGVQAEKVLPIATNMPDGFYGWYYSETCAESEKVSGTDRLYGTNHVLNIYAKYVDDAPVTPATYKIVLHTGVFTMDTEIDATVGVAYPLPNLSRTGYTLKGWSATEGGNIEWNPGDCVLLRGAPDSGEFHVYAIWEENTVVAKDIKVFYHRMNGSQEFTVETHKDNERFQLEAYTDLADATHRWTLPEGKKVDYWQDANGNKYRVGTWITVGAVTKDEFHLYPVFEDAPATEYTVTFYCWYHQKENEKQPFARDTRIVIDPNGGTYAGSTTKTEITVTSNVTVKDASRYGYSFDGWYVTKDNAGVYTFTAVWDNNYYYNTYSIYYYDYDDCKSEYANFPYGTSIVIDPNGGTAKLSGTSFSTKQYFNIYRDYTLTDASRSGYTFYGWDLTKSGSTYYFTAMWSRYKSDVPYMLNGTDHYAYIKGYPNGSFKPTDTITRAEAATIFYRLLTDSTRKAYATTYNSFKDVPATAWYNTAVSTMAKLGIVNGGADGYFRPNDPITRAEIAAMIARCDGAYYTGTSTVFSDTYGHWAAGYIDRAYELGWINGYGTTYAPDRYISRAETVAVLNRVLNRAPQYTSDLTRNYTTFSDVATSAWYYLDVEEAANSHTYTRKSNADYETWTKLIADPSWF